MCTQTTIAVLMLILQILNGCDEKIDVCNINTSKSSGDEEDLKLGISYIDRSLKILNEFNLKEVEKLLKEAEKLLKELVNKGNVKAQYNLGLLYVFRYLNFSSEDDFGKAEELLKELVDNKKAQNILIFAYIIQYAKKRKRLKGENMQRNVIKLYDKIDDTIDFTDLEKFIKVSAEGTIGIAYGSKYFLDGDPKDFYKAEKLLIKSNNYQSDLGALYVDKYMRDKDLKDFDKAEKFLVELFDRVKKEYNIAKSKYTVTPSEDLVLLNLKEVKYEKVQNILGRLYAEKYLREGDPKDLDKAEKLLNELVNKGNVESQNILGSLYVEIYKKDFDPKDLGKAEKLLKELANKGNVEAQDILGLLYIKIYKKDEDLEYLDKAGELLKDTQNIDGKISLGKIYIKRYQLAKLGVKHFEKTEKLLKETLSLIKKEKKNDTIIINDTLYSDKLESDYEYVQFLLGKLYLFRCNREFDTEYFDKGEKILKELLKKKVEYDGRVRHYLGWLYTIRYGDDSGRAEYFDKAEKLLKEAKEVSKAAKKNDRERSEDFEDLKNNIIWVLSTLYQTAYLYNNNKYEINKAIETLQELTKSKNIYTQEAIERLKELEKELEDFKTSNQI